MPQQYDEGNYSVRIDGQKLTKNERSGNYQVVIEFTPETFLDPAGEPHVLHNAEPRRLFLPVTDKAAQITYEKLGRLGLIFDDWRQVDDSRSDCVRIIGDVVDLYCKWDSWEGRMREKWDVPRDRVELAPLEDQEVDEVNALFGHVFGSGVALPPTGRAKAAGPVRVDKDSNGDDLAF